MGKYRSEIIIIMGYLSAYVGILGGEIYKNGEMLPRLTEENDIEIANLAKGKITLQRKGGEEKSAIDYVLLNKVITK